MNQLKTHLKNLEFYLDYHFTIFLYNPNKVDRYHDYMTKKWGDRYTNSGTTDQGRDQDS